LKTSQQQVCLDFSGAQARQLAAWLLALECLLVALFLLNRSFGAPFRPINNLLDLDGERSLAVWFSATQLFVVAVVLALVARLNVDRSVALTRLLWLVSAGFIFLSIDEALSMHEQVTSVLKHLTWVPRFRGDHGIWVFLYGLIGSALMLMCLRPLLAWRVRRPYPVACMVSGFAVLLVGGVLLEVLSYQFIRNRGLPELYTAEVCLEELLEMVGGTVLLYGALLLLLAESAARVTRGVAALEATRLPAKAV
jgi:hypothetical protein